MTAVEQATVEPAKLAQPSCGFSRRVAAHRAAIGPHPSSVPVQGCQIVVVELLLCLAQSSTRSHETQPKFLAPANWWAREHGELVEMALSIVRD